MVDVVAIVEGKTEQTFVRDLLADHLGHRSVFIRAIPAGKRGRGGGVRNWDGASKDIMRVLKGECYCTTMFDYYGMPRNWPRREEAHGLPWKERARHVEQAILDDITAKLDSSFNPEQLLPYVQLHEFEALLFSNVPVLADQLKTLPRVVHRGFQDYLQRILDEVGDPEAINDNYDMCPSRRITKLAPSFGRLKASQGPIITSRIGLPTLREKCTHFGSWIERLENLGEMNRQ